MLDDGPRTPHTPPTTAEAPPVLVPPPQDPPPSRAAYPLNLEDANLIIHTSDNVSLYVHSIIVALGSNLAELATPLQAPSDRLAACARRPHHISMTSGVRWKRVRAGVTFPTTCGWRMHLSLSPSNALHSPAIRKLAVLRTQLERRKWRLVHQRAQLRRGLL